MLLEVNYTTAPKITSKPGLMEMLSFGAIDIS